jgi:hypothetical protein
MAYADFVIRVMAFPAKHVGFLALIAYVDADLMRMKAAKQEPFEPAFAEEVRSSQP